MTIKELKRQLESKGNNTTENWNNTRSEA